MTRVNDAGRPNYNERRFRVTSNSASGESDGDTLFNYRQQGDLIWATYQGGSVRLGTLVGRVLGDGSLEFRYQHLNKEDQFRSGQCKSTLEILPDGRYRLHERWQWTDPPGDAGESIADEVRADG